jgi:Lon-like ATP-dependent protease
MNPRPDRKIPAEPQVGLATGLAVYGPHLGTVLEIEVSATPAFPRQGTIQITGLVDEEEMSNRQRTLRRKSMARGSVENVITVLRQTGIRSDDYHLHINFPGGVPLDGPSAGITMATAICSAIQGVPVDNRLAMTGELSIHGFVKPVGGIIAKVEAAKQAGAKRVIIPAENMQAIFKNTEGIEVIPVERIETVLDLALIKAEQKPEVAEGLLNEAPAVFSPTSAPV